MSLWILLFVGVVAAVYSTEHEETSGTEAAPCAYESVAWPEDDLDLPPTRVFDPSADSPGPVRFDHAVHVDACEPRCGVCHETAWRRKSLRRRRGLRRLSSGRRSLKSSFSWNQSRNRQFRMSKAPHARGARPPQSWIEFDVGEFPHDNSVIFRIVGDDRTGIRSLAT